MKLKSDPKKARNINFLCYAIDSVEATLKV